MLTTYKLTYNNKDITQDIASDLIDIEYTDNVNGQSDELTIRLQDANGLWKNEQYPELGAIITCQIIQDNEILDCGRFEYDETDFMGSRDGGDVFAIKCLAAGIKEAIRTRKSSAHQNKTLREIVNTIASKYGYKVIGTIPDVRIGYEVQHRVTDLQYLDRLAAQYGVQFSVRGNQMVFTSIYDLENAQAIFTLGKSQLINYNIKDKTADTYLRATSSYFNPKTKKLVQFSVDGSEVVKFQASPKKDFLQIRTRAENETQAQIKAKAALYRANSLQQEGNIAAPGNILLVAGVNIQLNELGNGSGIWHITQAKHSVTREGGYITDCQIKRVGVVAAELRKQQNP
jgi:phage protein D